MNSNQHGSQQDEMQILVIIPAYNEAESIRDVVDRAMRHLPVLVVDDGSRDATAEEAKKTGARVYRQEPNQGKGAALRRGFKEASGEVVVVQDADLEYDPNEYPKLLEPIRRGVADVVYGSRFLGGPHRVLYFWHYVGNRFLTILSNMFTNLNLTDMETCYKMFRREVLDRIEIKEDRFGVEPEFTAKVAKMDCRIYEVPISYYGRTYSEGKKIGWKDGLKALYCIIRYNLFP